MTMLLIYIPNFSPELLEKALKTRILSIADIKRENGGKLYL